MTSHKIGNFCIDRQVTLEPLVNDLLHHWDDTYSAERFPPSSKFQDIKIDKAKNRYILSHQIHLLPMIQQLCLAFEELVGGITVDAVWVMMKTTGDDGFQGWHQDLVHKISTTIVVNVGVATSTRTPLPKGYDTEEEVDNNTEEEVANYTEYLMD